MGLKGTRKAKLLVSANLILFLLIAFSAFSHNAATFKSKYKSAGYYQLWFAPAARMACGQGFTGYDLENEKSKLLRRFLSNSKKTPHSFIETLSCEDVRIAAEDDLIPSHYFHRYLISMAGLVWKYKGISWRNVYVVAGIFGVFVWLAIALMFGVFIPQWLSSLLVLFYLHFSNFNHFIIHLRDYSKAPFFLLFMFCFISVVKKVFIDKKETNLLWRGAVLGGILGLSLGFRIDLKILLFPMVVLTCLMMFDWKRIGLKSIAKFILSFVVFYMALGAPIHAWRDIDGHALSHVLNLGLADRFDKELGFETPAYSKATKYNDRFVAAQISHLNNIETNYDDFQYLSKDYEAVGKLLFFDWIQMFPADIYSRLIGSSWQILKMPYVYIKTDVNENLYSAVVLFSLVIVVFYLLTLPFPTSLFLVIVSLFFLSFPSLQFTRRHYFHLEPLAFILVLAPIFWLLGEFLRGPQGLQEKIQSIKVRWRASGIFIFALVLIFLIIPMGLRSYQNSWMRGYASEINERLHTPVETTYESQGKNSIIGLPIGDPVYKDFPYKDVDYYRIDFNLRKCPKNSFKVFFRWKSESRYLNYEFKRNFSNELQSESTEGTVFIPSFHISRSRFDSIELVNHSDPKCVNSVARVDSLEGLPILPFFFLFKPIDEINFNYQRL